MLALFVEDASTMCRKWYLKGKAIESNDYSEDIGVECSEQGV